MIRVNFKFDLDMFLFDGHFHTETIFVTTEYISGANMLVYQQVGETVQVKKGESGMRKSKSYKYKNYGPIPQNEYSTVNLGKSSDTASVLGVVPQAVDAAHRQSLIKQQARHPSGRRKSWGWSHSWKTNGWRAESAALHDEGSYMEGDSTYL